MLLIGNRQRAIGNILHDAAHRNLSRRRWINDGLAVAIVAPLAFLSLRSYRAAHFAHHLDLGHARDPDLLPTTESRPAKWWREYARQLASGSAWMGSIAGHVLDQEGRLVRSRLDRCLVVDLAGHPWSLPGNRVRGHVRGALAAGQGNQLPRHHDAA